MESTPQCLDMDLVVSAYVRAWNQGDDATARWRFLSQCWQEDGDFEDGVVALHGRRALEGYIARFRQVHPDARFAMTGVPTRDQETLSFGWTLIDGGGQPTMWGHTLALVGASGRLCRVFCTLRGPATRSPLARRSETPVRP